MSTTTDTSKGDDQQKTAPSGHEQMNAFIRAPRQTPRLRVVSENGRGRVVAAEDAGSKDGQNGGTR